MSGTRNIIVSIKGLTNEDLVNYDIRILSEDKVILEPKASSYKIIGEFISSGMTYAVTFGAIASDLSSQFLPNSVAHFFNAPVYFAGHAFNRLFNRASRLSFDTGAEQLGLFSGISLRTFTAVATTGMAMGGDALLEHYGCYSADPKAKYVQQAAVGCVANILGRVVETGFAKCAQKKDDETIQITVSTNHSSLYGQSAVERNMKRDRLLDQDHGRDIEMGRSVKKGRT